jgi:hypothetical protein
MQLIQHQELGSAQSSITFSSIPQTFTDLYLVLSARVTTTNGGLRIRVNGGTANLSTRLLYGNGSSAASGTDTTYVGTVTNSNQTANTFGSTALYFPNYAGSTAKSFSGELVDETNATTATQWVTAGLFNSTSPITAIEFSGDGAGNFVQYSSATLYGITKGSDGIVTVS